MAGLDNAGMNRADGNLEDAFTLDVTKPVFALLPADRLIPQEIFPQRMGALGPVFMTNQTAEIRMALRDQTEQITNLPLIPLRCMDERGNRGEETIVPDHVYRQEHPVPVHAEPVSYTHLRAHETPEH